MDDLGLNMLLVSAGVLAAGASAAGVRKVTRKRKTYTRAEAEAIIAHLESISHRHWTEERREKEIQHIMEKHRK